MSDLQLLDIGARKFRRHFAGRFGQELHHGAILQHDDADDGFGDGRPGDDDAVVLQQHAAAGAERPRHAGAHRGAADQIDGVGVAAERLVEQRAGLAVAFERPAGRRQRDRIGRVGVDDAIDVGPRLEDLGMDIDLAVAARGAGDDIAVEIDGEDVCRRDLVKAETVRLHEEQAGIVRQTKRNMAAGEIVLALRHQHFAGDDELLLDGLVRLLFPVRLEHFPHPIATLTPCSAR